MASRALYLFAFLIFSLVTPSQVALLAIILSFTSFSQWRVMGLNPQGFLLSISTLFPVWSHVASRVNVFLLHSNDFYILVSSVDSLNVQNCMSSIRANISHGSVIEPMNLTCPTLRSSSPLVVTLSGVQAKNIGSHNFLLCF